MKKIRLISNFLIKSFNTFQDQRKKKMSAPREAHNIQLVKIQRGQSLTNSPELNPALVKVTEQVKPGSRMYQAATQVNVLSPVIFNIIEVDTLHLSGRQHCKMRFGKYLATLSGSEAVA